MNLVWASLEPELLLPGDYTQFALLEDQRLLLLGKDMLRLVSLPTFETLDTLQHGIHAPRCLTVDHAGARAFVSGSTRAQLRAFDLGRLESPTVLKISGSAWALASTPRNRRVLALSQGHLDVVAAGGKKPQVGRTLPLPGEGVFHALAVDPDEQLLAIARDGKVELRRADSLQFKLGFPVPPGVRALAFSPRGDLLAGAGGEAVVVEEGEDPTYTVSGTEVHLWDPSSGASLGEGRAHTMVIRALAWHPRLPLLASGDMSGNIHLWEVSPDRPGLLHYGALQPQPYAHGLRHLEFTPDGDHLLALNSRGLAEYRLEDVPSLKRPTAPPRAASARVDLGLGWPTHAEVHEGQLWVSGTGRWARVDLGQRQVIELSEEDDLARVLQPQPRYDQLLRWREVDDSSDRIEVRTLDGRLLTQVDDVPTATFNTPMLLTRGGQDLMYGVGGRLYVSALEGERHTRSAEFDDGVVTKVSFRTPEDLVLTTSGFGDRMNVRLWNARTLASTVVLDRGALAAFSGWLECSLLAEDGQLALGSSQGEVGVFDLHRGTQVMFATRHDEGTVNDLAFSPDGTLLASGADDGTVRLWDPRSGEARGVLHHPEPVRLVRFTPDGQAIVSIDSKGTLLFWDSVGAPTTAGTGTAPAHAPALGLTVADAESEREAYLGRAREAHLAAFAERSWELHQRTAQSPEPRQPHESIIEAYEHAKRHAVSFDATVRACAAALEVEHRLRPNGVKDANRAIEKMSGKDKHGNPKALPLDLLGGTLICTSLGQMYEVAGQLLGGSRGFEVVRFRDRMVDKVDSGYGDLQLIVSLDGHLAEIKVVHEIIQQVDAYEHRVYEIQRSIEAKFRAELPPVEDYVTKALLKATREMYTQAWDLVLRQEGKADD